MSLKTESIKIECEPCAGSGLYRGFAEPKGVAVVCVSCDGSGCQTFKYAPFTARQARSGIDTVSRVSEREVAAMIGPASSTAASPVAVCAHCHAMIPQKAGYGCVRCLAVHPLGVTCNDCGFVRYCKGLIGISGAETFCDWIPSRLTKRNGRPYA